MTKKMVSKIKTMNFSLKPQQICENSVWWLWGGSISYCNTFLWHCSMDWWLQPDERRLWEIQPDQTSAPLAESRVCVAIGMWSSKGSLEHSVPELHQREWAVPTGLVGRIRIRGEANSPHPNKCQINSSGVIGCYLTVGKWATATLRHIG